MVLQAMNKTIEEKDLILEVIGQKWVVTFDMPDGTKSGGMFNSHLALPSIISKIRSDGGKNIVITDRTIFFVDNEKE